MDSMARSYRTPPADLLGLTPGSWDAALVNAACRLAGLGQFAERIEDARSRKTMIFPALILDGGP
jgi:hypothetical protein